MKPETVTKCISHMSFKVSHLPATWLFVQKLIQDKPNESVKALNSCPFMNPQVTGGGLS